MFLCRPQYKNECLTRVFCASLSLQASHGGSCSFVHSVHPPHIVTQHIHEYHVDIPLVSVPLLGFHHDSTIAKKEVYDVLFYFKKGKNDGRHRDNNHFERC